MLYNLGISSVTEQHVIVSIGADGGTSMLHRDQPLTDDQRGTMTACREFLYS